MLDAVDWKSTANTTLSHEPVSHEKNTISKIPLLKRAIPEHTARNNSLAQLRMVSNFFERKSSMEREHTFRDTRL